MSFKTKTVGAILMQLCVCPLGGALEIVYQGIWLMRQQVCIGSREAHSFWPFWTGLDHASSSQIIGLGVWTELNKCCVYKVWTFILCELYKMTPQEANWKTCLFIGAQ